MSSLHIFQLNLSRSIYYNSAQIPTHIAKGLFCSKKKGSVLCVASSITKVDISAYMLLLVLEIFYFHAYSFFFEEMHVALSCLNL
jgi:hypothetical protein